MSYGCANLIQYLKKYYQRGQKRNIDTSRLVFADKVPMDVHLARYKLADLFLDTFNFNAHTTLPRRFGLVFLLLKQGEVSQKSGSSLLNAMA